jgi:hypothetical protein
MSPGQDGLLHALSCELFGYQPGGASPQVSQFPALEVTALNSFPLIENHLHRSLLFSSRQSLSAAVKGDHYGPVILIKFSKIAMLQVVLNRQKISKTILEKASFFIVWHFYLFSVFVLINFKIGPSER